MFFAVKLNDLQSALQSFEKALDMAKLQGEYNLQDLNFSFGMKKQSLKVHSKYNTVPVVQGVMDYLVRISRVLA